MSECMTQEDAMNMSNEQAVQILKPFRDMMLDQYGCPISDAFFALGKAIEALKREERKTGKWIYRPEIGWGDAWVCSECEEITKSTIMGKPRYNYCPNCGARMEKDDET